MFVVLLFINVIVVVVLNENEMNICKLIQKHLNERTILLAQRSENYRLLVYVLMYSGFLMR